MSNVYTTGCDLHIPHKEWSGDERERQNYLEMERWAHHFRTVCIAEICGLAGGGIPPESPALIAAAVNGHGFCYAGLAPSPALEDNVRYSPPSILGPGITYDLPNGTGIPVQPYAYGSAFYSEPVHWVVPPCRNVHVHLSCTFTEDAAAPYNVEPVNRALHIRLRRNTDSVDVADLSQIFMGTRASTPATLHIGPYDIPVPFTVHTYCLWNSVHTGGAANNVLVDTGGLLLTGELI